VIRNRSNFNEQRRRKRNASESEAKNIKKAAKHTTGERETQILSQLELKHATFSLL
jgi:hypothetical protein